MNVIIASKLNRITDVIDSKTGQVERTVVNADGIKDQVELNIRKEQKVVLPPVEEKKPEVIKIPQESSMSDKINKMVEAKLASKIDEIVDKKVAEILSKL